MPGKTPREVIWPLALVRRGGEILLRRRGTNGILAGLWELPGGEKTRGESLHALLARHLDRLNGNLTRPVRVGELRHAITTRKIRAPIFLFAARTGARLRLKHSEWRWVARSALWRYPVSSMTLKAATILASHEKASR